MANPFDQFDAQPAASGGNPFDQFDAAPQASGADTAAEQQQPSVMDYLRTNAFLGAPAHTLYRAGEGVEQLVAHGAASASDLGGNAPNTLSKALHAIADHIDAVIGQNEQDYKAAKDRMVNASNNPRLERALIDTGEIEGNLLNPAGMAGNLIPEAPGIVNAALRGAGSGAAYAATQPVADTPDYFANKAKQVAVGAGTGAATGAIVGTLAGKSPEPPTTKDLKDQASDAYKNAEAQGAVINQDSFQNAVSGIKAAAQKAGLDQDLTPKASAVLRRLQSDAEQGPMTFENAETLRKVALAGLDTPEKNDRRLTHLIIDKLDDYMEDLQPSDIASGNAPEALSSLQEARDLYRRSAKSADIDRIVEKARNAVGANYTAAGFDTALRQKFRVLADNQQAFSRFSPAEQQAILKIVRGGGLQNTLRYIGKLSPTSGLALGAEIVGSLHEPEIAIPAAVGGYAARQASAKMGVNNVNTLSELVRRGNSFAPPPGPAPNAFIGNAATGLAINALLQPRGQ